MGPWAVFLVAMSAKWGGLSPPPLPSHPGLWESRGPCKQDPQLDPPRQQGLGLVHKSPSPPVHTCMSVATTCSESQSCPVTMTLPGGPGAKTQISLALRK